MKTESSGIHTPALKYKVGRENKNKIADEFSSLKNSLRRSLTVVEACSL